MTKSGEVKSDKHARVGVGVIIEKDGKVLLMKRTGSHGANSWSPPGGHVDFGETIEETAQREVDEEVGIKIGAATFRAVTNDIFPNERKHYVTVWMEAEYIGGNPKINSARELTEIQWFEWNSLPEPLFIPFKNLVEGRFYS